MFTGLIETMGNVVGLTKGKQSARIAIESDLPVSKMADGESVAVDGVCLTVAARRGAIFEADVIPETLRCTNLGKVGTGRKVNLERALRLTDRLGGHLVQGHVDGVERVQAVRTAGGEWVLRIAVSPPLRRYLAWKGSVAVNGVSLTVSGVGSGWFEVSLIPETRSRTNLGSIRRGSQVHVEVDLLARYLETWMRHRGDAARGGRV
jgi:riboflavin synthase